MVRTCGRICAVGFIGGEDVSFQWNKAMYKALDIVFNFSSSYTAWDRGLSLMAETDMDIGSLITHREDIGNWEKVFRELEEEKGIKALFIPRGEGER
jgi:threonine dehydrogenase-like Zn-dependent dehydrogenase